MSAHTMAPRSRLARFRPAYGGASEKVTAHSRRTGVPLARSGMPRRQRRLFAFAAIALVAIAVAVIVATRGGSRQYHVILQNAGLLVPGDVVRIGGVQAGSVDGLDLTPDGQADVTVSLGKSWGRLHAGSTVT